MGPSGLISSSPNLTTLRLANCFVMSGVAALAAALPACATACLLTAIESSSCAITNQTCVCDNGDLNAEATSCISVNCTIREALFTKNLTSTTCGLAPNTDYTFVPVFIVFSTLSAVAVLLRVVARLQAKIPVWWDDFIITLSFLGCVAYTTISCTIRHHGLGTDIWAVPFDDITLFFKGLYALCAIYASVRHLVRLSILFFYQRIFGHIRLARRLIQFTHVLIISSCISFTSAILFGCAPLDYFWTSWDGQHEGHCANTSDMFWAGAVIDISIDFWIILLPLRFILRLNLSMRKKILSVFTFGFGILVIIISLYRLTTINHSTRTQNPTIDFVPVGLWAGLELNVGVICACLPSLYPLLKSVYAWLSLMSYSKTSPSCPTNSCSSNNYGHHDYLDDRKLSSESMAPETTRTTIHIEQHPSESQIYLSSPGWGDFTQSVHMELGRRNNEGTGLTAWS
ncbi:hypothetical protein F5Y13DRAFT_155003 [Hypoxylon sp. FL1857]|nr:hypothetical protein F5Y13DRAFT_155003 [Hypoxylon sp. FL1857]